MSSAYNLLSKNDIDEIDNVLEFANGLVLHDIEKAESMETVESYRLSNEFIRGRLELQGGSIEEIEKFNKGYTEINKYYRDLHEKYDLDYYELRTAKDLQILAATRQTLTKEESTIFYTCFYEVLNYHNRVTNTKAFKNQDMYKGFIKLFLIFSTVQRYLTKKMENFFNIDIYDEKTLKNAFISNGLDYFEDMPINYQRRLLKMINTLLANKGTNNAITQIIEIFGFDNIDIYKYVLSKGYGTDPKTGKLDYNDPYLLFFKTPANEELDIRNNVSLSYDTITKEDPYWQTTKEEVVNIPFNFINSKYMSVDTTIDAMNETIGLSYFMSLLQKFQLDYKEKEGRDFGFINKNISLNTINIYDAIVALQSLIIRNHGYEDTIAKNPDAINYIYGYRDIENKIDISNIIEDIEALLIKHHNTINNYDDIQSFIETFKVSGFNEKETYSIDNFIEVFNKNEVMRKSLEELLIETNNYYIYRKLQDIWDIEMRAKINNTIYNGNDTFIEYIKNNNYDLYSYISLPDNIKGNETQEYRFYKEKIFELTESIGNYMSDVKVRKYFMNNNFVGLSSYIEKYLYTIISLFKSYTVDLLSANIIFSFDDKAFNTIKLFDNATVTPELQIADRVDLLDINNLIAKQTELNEKIFFKDSIKITVETE